jgi:hypothetical protein
MKEQINIFSETSEATDDQHKPIGKFYFTIELEMYSGRYDSKAEAEEAKQKIHEKLKTALGENVKHEK